MPYLNLKTTHKLVRGTFSNFTNLMRDVINPNNLNDKICILYLIKQAITVSLETVEIVNNLPPLEIIEEGTTEAT